MRADFGMSYSYPDRSVKEIIIESAKISLKIGFLSIIFTFISTILISIYLFDNSSFISLLVKNSLYLFVGVPTFLIGAILIILFAVNITSSSVTNKIEIEVIPESNDIIAKQNLYIVLDTTSGSKLTLLEDLVSSGSDRSGSSYAPPSSFVNTTRFTR